MLKPENTVLVVIDFQGKLAQLMHDRDPLFQVAATMIQGIKVLDIPFLVTEQNPDRIGPTIPEIAPLLKEPPISKLSFSCCGEKAFMDRLKALNRGQILIIGIETHICVYQTAADLIDQGYEVQVAADAVSSRTQENRSIGLEKIQHIGASLTSVETALFELLGTAANEQFKDILKLIK